MISTDKYFQPTQDNERIAVGFLAFDSVDKPLFYLPPNVLITEFLIGGDAFTVDGIPADEDLGQSVKIGTPGNKERFIAADSFMVNANPMYGWGFFGDAAVVDSLGTGVVLSNFFFEGGLVIGSYVLGDSGENGGGPVIVMFRYIML